MVVLGAVRRRILPLLLALGRRRLAALGVGVALLASYPLTGGWIGARMAAWSLARRSGYDVAVDSGRAGLGTLALTGVVVGARSGRPPVAALDRVVVPLAALWGGGVVEIDGARIHVERTKTGDDLGPLLARLGARAGGAPGGGGSGGARGTGAALRGGSLTFKDSVAGRFVAIGSFEASYAPGGKARVLAHQISGSVRLRGGEADPTFGAARIEASARLDGARGAGLERIEIEDGFVRPLPTVPLTGIRGRLGGVPGTEGAGVTIDLAGSYGGARRALWTATGNLRRGAGGRGPEGLVSIRAERFTLDKIAEILPKSILEPERAAVDAALDFRFAGDRVGFSGNLGVAGLGVEHQRLSAEPLLDLEFGVRLAGAVEPARRRLEVTELDGRIGDLEGRVAGSVELRPGTFRAGDGSEMPSLPLIDLTLRVPRIACARLLASLPQALVPKLDGFVLQGTFEAEVRAKIDYARLDDLVLGGKVGIGGCKVVKAPPAVVALKESESLPHEVEVPPLPPADPGGADTLSFVIGPDSPDFVPFAQISPHVVNSIMTTEDSGFFKHRGFVTSEFKTALRRNLAGGGFRLGASSITMQMVKNVLLTHEKTLSRKLQELFLVWHIEQELPKERILELYFNAIEFGPRVYGIGAAARHYFGKPASDLGPLEAAFFSSILPSPKRRYVQYCHGALTPAWDKYVRRILARMHERGRLGDEEYAAAAAEKLVFDTTARDMSEKQCLDWVRRMTAHRPEPEPDPDAP